MASTGKLPQSHIVKKQPPAGHDSPKINTQSLQEIAKKNINVGLRDGLSGARTDSRDLYPWNQLTKQGDKKPYNSIFSPQSGQHGPNRPNGPHGPHGPHSPHGPGSGVRPEDRYVPQGKDIAARKGATIFSGGKNNPFNVGANLDLDSIKMAGYLQGLAEGSPYGLGGLGTGLGLGSSLGGINLSGTTGCGGCSSNNKDLQNYQTAAMIVNALGGPQGAMNVVGSVLNGLGSVVSNLFGGIFGGGDSSSDITSGLGNLTNAANQAFQNINSNDPQVRQNAWNTLNNTMASYDQMGQQLVSSLQTAENEVTKKSEAYKSAQAKTEGISNQIAELERSMQGIEDADKKRAVQGKIDELKKQLIRTQEEEKTAKTALDQANTAKTNLEQQISTFMSQYDAFSAQYTKATQAARGINTEA